MAVINAPPVVRDKALEGLLKSMIGLKWEDHRDLAVVQV